MFNTVLVPLDGSERAECGLMLAKQLDPEDISLLRVVNIDRELMLGMEYSSSTLHALAQAERDAGVYLRTLAEKPAYAELAIQTYAASGDPARNILDRAAAIDADLIVMTTHGYTGVQRWLYGSVTERVLSRAPCPVLVLRNDVSLTHVLITVDGSALSEQALAPGLELAARLHADVTLLFVIEPLNLADVEVPNDVERRFGRDAIAAAEKYLSTLVQTWRRPALYVATRVVSGHAAPQILSAAHELGSDVVVMSTHGRSGIQRWVYGSVTEKVLRGTGTAMLVVRATQEVDL